MPVINNETKPSNATDLQAAYVQFVAQSHADDTILVADWNVNLLPLANAKHPNYRPARRAEMAEILSKADIAFLQERLERF